MLRPYVPHGMKRIGEGEGHLTYIQSVNFQTESSSMFKVSMFFWIKTLSSMLGHCQQLISTVLDVFQLLLIINNNNNNNYYYYYYCYYCYYCYYYYYYYYYY